MSNNAEHTDTSRDSGSDEVILHRMQHQHSLSQLEREEISRGETEERVLTFQTLMMQQERTSSQLKFISNQQSLLGDVKDIEEKKFFTPSGYVKEVSVALAAKRPSSLSNVRDPNQRQLEDTLLGREISFPGKESVQESDPGNSSLLDAARKTANLVESSTTFPPRMLSSHDTWYLMPCQHYVFSSNNAIKDESIESLRLAAAAALNLSSESPKNEVDEYHMSVNAAQATSSSHDRSGETIYQEQFSIPLPSRSPVLSQCSEKEKRHVDDNKPSADSENDSG